MSRPVRPEVVIGGPELARTVQDSPDPWTRAHSEYLLPLLSDGPGAFMDNGRVELRVAICDGELLPLVATSRGHLNSEVCDLRTHYVNYIPMQFDRRGQHWAAHVARVRNLPAAILMTLGGLDRVLYVNNFLFSTNPRLRLDAAQILELTNVLTQVYPDRLLLVRSVHPLIDPALYSALLAAGFRMVRSRAVHLFDPSSPEVARRTNVKLDRRLLERTPHRLITDPADLERAVPRLTALYRSLYLTKYPTTNPAFNERFFAHMLLRSPWKFAAFESNGSIDAFTSWFLDGDFLVGAAIGHDLLVPSSAGLYRMTMAFLLEEARRQGVKAHLSAGADEFKRTRGGRRSYEFDAIYDRHLPARSRLGLAYLRRASNRGVSVPSSTSS